MKTLPLKIMPFIVAWTVQMTEVHAQGPDWSTTIASIVYTNCSSCHHTGGIAPFPLMGYQDAVDNAISIQDAVVNRHMPPWPADPAYRHFAYEAVLDSLEIAAINDWVNNGTPQGDSTLAPPVPVFSTTGSMLDTIHHTVQIPPYTLQYNTDEYRWFAMHTNFADTVYVSRIEVIPGLPHIVHHADIHYDLTGDSYLLDSLSPLPGFSGGMVSNYYMNAWQPGGNIATYPNNWGIMVPPGADFVLEIHYGPGGIGLIDTTKMNLQFITNPVNVRTVSVGWLLNNPIPSQGPLIIPPDTVITFNQLSAPMPVARSLISICPHMHLLGKSYKVWFETAAGDSVPLIDIPHWDFHWQKYYMFQQIQEIPAGARIHSIASYDNTANNPHNPNSPPITVTYGPTTEDEMLMTYFIYATYQAGDENIILDSTLITSAPYHPGSKTHDHAFNTYPNPSKDYFTIDGSKAAGSKAMLEIYDPVGNLIEKRLLTAAETQISERINLGDYSAGIYYFRIISESGMLASGKLISVK